MRVSARRFASAPGWRHRVDTALQPPGLDRVARRQRALALQREPGQQRARPALGRCGVDGGGDVGRRGLAAAQAHFAGEPGHVHAPGGITIAQHEPATGGGTNVKGSGLNITLWGGRVFSATTLAVWTRQIAGLVAAGLPLEAVVAVR